MSKEHGRRAESTHKPGDEHITPQRSRAALAVYRRDIPIYGTDLCPGQACLE